MKIFRGPSSKAFSDDSHELVATTDIGAATQIWHDAVLLRANITKEMNERQAVAHIQLDASDVLSLHSKLLTGLLSRSANFDKTEARIGRILQQLYIIYEKVDAIDDGEIAETIKLDLLDHIGIALGECNVK